MQTTRSAAPGRSLPTFLALLALFALTAAAGGCSARGASTSSEPGATSDTSGGSEPSASGDVTGVTGATATEPEGVHPPRTALIPVPLPAQPRETLSPTLQQVWTLVEEGSAQVRPDYEGEMTAEAIQSWLDSTFTAWAQSRGARSAEAATAAASIPAGSVELAVSGALVGYSYEEFVIAFLGAPVAEDIAADPELLRIYLDALSEASLPFARQAAAAYGTCARILAPLGPESPWVEWAAYCVERAAEVNEIYRLE